MKAGNYYVRWAHGIAVTTCIVEKNNGEEFVGVSMCGHGDPYVKKIGRKLSLSRAIRNLSKPERKEIWDSIIAKGVKMY